MTKQRSTKRALILSALSLLLCVSMLIGSTYAWFTDSVVSGSNVITSGNLDLEVQYTLDGDNWANLDGANDLFRKGLWEPGHTEVMALKIENKGSLAFKYAANMNIINEVVGINKDGGDIVLSEILTVSTLRMDGGAIGAALAGTIFSGEDAAIWNSTDVVTSSFKNGNVLANDNIVLAGEDAFVLIKVDMAETVGNEANHNGVDVPSIEFGLNVLATQYTYENDSFGNQYDKDAEYPDMWDGTVDTAWYNDTDTEFTIATSEELAGLAAIVNGTATTNARTAIQDDFAGKTIKLASDINLNNINWTPIGSFEYDRDAQKYANYVVFRGNFDGQGHTINNLKINAPTTEGVALFACAEAGTIQNLTMNNVNIVGGSHAGAILGRGGSAYGKKNTITNCHVTGDINIVVDWAYAGAIVGKANTLSISGCTVTPNGDGVITATNRNAVGSVLGWIEQPSTIANCKATNMKLTGWANIGSISGFLSQGTTMEGCYAENIVLTKTRELGHPTIGLFAGGFSYSANQAITIKDSTAKNITLNGTHIAAPASANVLYGAEFGGNANSNFVLDNNTTENITNNLEQVTA